MVATYRRRFCAREEVISTMVGNLVLLGWASTMLCRVFHTVSKTPCVVFRSVMMSRWDTMKSLALRANSWQKKSRFFITLGYLKKISNPSMVNPQKGNVKMILLTHKGLSRNDVTLALLNKADTPLPPIPFRPFLADPPPSPLITHLCSDI